MLVELGGQVAVHIKEALMVTANKQEMKISGVTLYSDTFISTACHCPSFTGMLSASVKLVLLEGLLSSTWARGSSITMVLGHDCIVW